LHLPIELVASKTNAPEAIVPAMEQTMRAQHPMAFRVIDIEPEELPVENDRAEVAPLDLQAVEEPPVKPIASPAPKPPIQRKRGLPVWAIVGIVLVGITGFVCILTASGILAPFMRPSSPIQPAPTNQPIPTSAQQASVPLVLPTATEPPIPTATPIPPTATIPAPDKSLEYLTGVQVVYVDTFNDPSGNGWWLGNVGKIQNGVLEIHGNNWNAVGRDVSRTFGEDEGVIYDFTFTKGSVFETFFAHGDWYTDPYQRFGIYITGANAQADLFQGKNGIGFTTLNGNFALKPDTTYSLLMAVLPNGEFLAVIWDPANPSKTIYYRETIGKKWANQAWTFTFGANIGTIQMENYREIKFDGTK